METQLSFVAIFTSNPCIFNISVFRPYPNQCIEKGLASPVQSTPSLKHLAQINDWPFDKY